MVAYLTTQRWTRQFAVFLLPSRFASLRLTLRTVGAVEAAVLDGFGDVFGLDRVGTFEVGDGASDFQDAVVVAFCRACGGSDPIGCGAGLAGTRMRFAWSVYSTRLAIRRAETDVTQAAVEIREMGGPIQSGWSLAIPKAAGRWEKSGLA